MPYAVQFELFKMKKCCKLAMEGDSEDYRIWKKQRDLEKAMEEGKLDGEKNSRWVRGRVGQELRRIMGFGTRPNSS